MKLQAKLGISTGILVSAMLLSAVTAHVRVARANQISNNITTNQVPLIAAMQDLGIQLSLTVRALESSMLFGIEPATSRRFLGERGQSMNRADAALVMLRGHLRSGTAPIDLNGFHQVETSMARLKLLEEQSEQLNESHTSEGMSPGLRHHA